MFDEQLPRTQPEQAHQTPGATLEAALEMGRMLEGPADRACILGAVAGRTSDPTARKAIMRETVAALDAWSGFSNNADRYETEKPEEIVAFIAGETLAPEIIKQLPKGHQRDELLAKAALEHENPDIAPSDNEFGGHDAYWAAFAVKYNNSTALDHIEDPGAKLGAVAGLIDRAERAEDTEQAAALHTQALSMLLEVPQESGRRDEILEGYARNLDPGYAELIDDPVVRASVYMQLAEQNPKQWYFDEAAKAVREAEAQGTNPENGMFAVHEQRLWQQLALHSKDMRWVDEMPQGPIRDETIAKVALETGNVQAALGVEDEGWRTKALLDFLRQGQDLSLAQSLPEGRLRVLGMAAGSAHITDLDAKTGLQRLVFADAAELGPRVLLEAVTEMRNPSMALELLDRPGISTIQLAQVAVSLNCPELALHLPQDAPQQTAQRDQALQDLVVRHGHAELISEISSLRGQAWTYIELYDTLHQAANPKQRA